MLAHKLIAWRQSNSAAALGSTHCCSNCPDKRNDTIDDLHWKTDRQAASLI